MLEDSYTVGNFNWSLGDVHSATLESLTALSLAVGWAHRLHDWAFLREVGEGLVATDETGRVHGAAMWFPFGTDFATVGMVITSPRLQKHGGAQWLMRQVIEQNQDRHLGLHATNQSHKLFRSLGFVDQGIVCQYEGTSSQPATAPIVTYDGDLHEFKAADLLEAEALDQKATGVDRRHLIAALASRSKGVVLRRSGNIDAVALARSFGRGMVVGPVIASNEDDAARVMRPLLAASDGEFVRIDIPEHAGQLSRLAECCGLQRTQTVTRMSLGRPWPYSAAASAAVWSLATHATG